MSSWSLLIASQGLVLEGPKGILGFKPNWQPDDHRSFFTAPEGWGLFIQRRESGQQTERIEVRHGQLRLRELVFELPGTATATAAVTIAGRPIATVPRQVGSEIRLVLKEETVVPEGSAVDVVLRWKE
jgi:non-lysosomal glucosylceramidase